MKKRISFCLFLSLAVLVSVIIYLNAPQDVPQVVANHVKAVSQPVMKKNETPSPHPSTAPITDNSLPYSALGVKRHRFANA